MELNLAEMTGDASAFATMAWAWGVEFLPRLGSAVIVMALGYFIAGWAARAVRGVLTRTKHVDYTVVPVLATVVRYAILILVLVAALGQLGVQTTSLLAVLGAAGLAIGLALQGTLQNIAAGIMLLYLRPFRIGDYIETPAVSGTVKEIGLFVTHLDTGDGLYFFAPNSSLWNVPLKNYTRNPRRMMNIQFGISYTSDPAEARRVILAMAEADQRLLKDPPPRVFVEKYGESAVTITFQAWAPNAAFWDVQRDTDRGGQATPGGGGDRSPLPATDRHGGAAGRRARKGGCRRARLVTAGRRALQRCVSRL